MKSSIVIYEYAAKLTKKKSYPSVVRAWKMLTCWCAYLKWRKPMRIWGGKCSFGDIPDIMDSFTVIKSYWVPNKKIGSYQLLEQLNPSTCIADMALQISFSSQRSSWPRRPVRARLLA